MLRADLKQHPPGHGGGKERRRRRHDEAQVTCIHGDWVRAAEAASEGLNVRSEEEAVAVDDDDASGERHHHRTSFFGAGTALGLIDM